MQHEILSNTRLNNLKLPFCRDSAVYQGMPGDKIEFFNVYHNKSPIFLLSSLHTQDADKILDCVKHSK